MTFLFEDIDAVIADEVRERRPDNWDPTCLHVTDLSACPRQVVLRAQGSPMRPLAAKDINMFDLANYQHERVYAALRRRGELVGCEEELPDLPAIGNGFRGWTGRLDYIRRLPNGQMRIGDIKTSHPNWIQYNKDGNGYPKPEHVMQVSTYWHYWHYRDDLDPMVEVVYLDRGGQNPSHPTVFEPLPLGYIRERMAEYEEWLSSDELPPLLPSGVKWGQKWSPTTGKIMFGPEGWQCRYCRVENCPNERQDHWIATYTKKRGLELYDMARHFEREIVDFLWAETKTQFTITPGMYKKGA